mgnify:CR=1 FL=1
MAFAAKGANMPALLQFEIDVAKLNSGYPKDEALFDPHKGMRARISSIARSALVDTLQNGGTFVVVVSATKITMVQRVEADEIEDADGASPAEVNVAGRPD